ncbi:MAG: LLM class flavin-dependent oxidoreductase [Acidimicrobiales bacterium]
MRSALFFGPFDELAEPSAVLRVASIAEEHGWDGLFLWDHMFRAPGEEGRWPEVADVWVTLAAVAATTSRLIVGPMVAPLARRRPQKVARETVTLDRLAGGRTVLGVGLGVDRGGELERFGEVTDERVRAEMLDEAIALVRELWSGALVDHHGRHFQASGVQFLPTPVRSRIPIWGAAVGTRPRRAPLQRAAALDGLFPVGADVEQVQWMLDVVRDARGSLDGFDVAFEVDPDRPPSREDLTRLGVTWVAASFPESVPIERVEDIARQGPAALLAGS